MVNSLARGERKGKGMIEGGGGRFDAITTGIIIIHLTNNAKGDKKMNCAIYKHSNSNLTAGELFMRLETFSPERCRRARHKSYFRRPWNS